MAKEKNRQAPPATSTMSDSDYEKLVQNVHRSIMKNQGITNIEVLHNIRIQGKSGHKHQIDVYWKFRIGNVDYQTAIECRKYKKNITVSGVKSFKATLDDIGNINGIMVTTNGYQRGAALFAQQYDIKLSVLRSVVDEDLDNTIQIIIVNINAISRNVMDFNINLSRSSVSESQQESIKSMRQLLATDEKDGVRDIDGNVKITWKEFSDRVQADNQKAEVGEPVTMKIDDAGMFFLYPDLGLVPIDNIVIRYVTHLIQTQIQVRNPTPPHYIMKTVNENGEIMHIHDDGTRLILK